jgi:hypothetical protein
MREEGWDIILRALATQSAFPGPDNAAAHPPTNFGGVHPPIQYGGVMRLLLSDTPGGKQVREAALAAFGFICLLVFFFWPFSCSCSSRNRNNRRSMLIGVGR